VALSRIGLVVHPSRDLERPLKDVRAWAAEHGVELVQIRLHDNEPEVAAPGQAADADLLVAVGGDGTVLGALRTGGVAGKAVLGVACGSLGALAAVPPDGVTAALDRVAAGDCDTHPIPALEVHPDGAQPLRALNDVVVVRAGAGQVRVSVHLDGALYARWSGDGMILATAVGTAAYTLAARGPLLAPPAEGSVMTALAPHGGCIPPLVAGAGARWDVEIRRGYGGARFEIDGQPSELPGTAFAASLRPDAARLLRLGDEEPFLAALRRRGIISDSPRVLAEDRRFAIHSRG